MKNRVLIPVIMALAFVSSIYAADIPRLAVGWTGGVGIYNPLNGEEIWRDDLESLSDRIRKVPLYIGFIDQKINNLLVGFYRHSSFYNGATKIDIKRAQSNGLAYLIIKNADLYEVITTASNDELKAYNFYNGAVTINFKTTNPRGATSLALFEQNGAIFIIAGTTTGYIDIYDYESENLVHSINTYEQGIHHGSFIVNVIVFSDDTNKKVIASTAVNPVATDSGQIACWDLHNFQKEYCVDFAERVNRNQSLSASADGDTNAILLYKDTDGSQKMVVTGRDPERVIKIWDPCSGKCIKKIKADQFDNNIYPIQSFESNNVVKLIVGYLSGYLAIWNTQTCTLETSVDQNYNKDSKVIRAITLFEAGDVQYCTVGSDNGDMHTYDLHTLTLITKWSVGHHLISAQACSNVISGNHQSQLSYFSEMLGCNVPFADLTSFCLNTNP